MKKIIKYINNSHLHFDIERSDGFYGRQESGILLDKIESDEIGNFQYKVYYRDYYSAKDCNCHPETCCHDYGWSRSEYKREKIYIKSTNDDK